LSIVKQKKFVYLLLGKAVLDQLGAIFRTPTMLADVYFRVWKMQNAAN
jgi:hypothetical protein